MRILDMDIMVSTMCMYMSAYVMVCGVLLQSCSFYILVHLILCVRCVSNEYQPIVMMYNFILKA